MTWEHVNGYATTVTQIFGHPSAATQRRLRAAGDVGSHVREPPFSKVSPTADKWSASPRWFRPSRKVDRGRRAGDSYEPILQGLALFAFRSEHYSLHCPPRSALG
jgi:hypothetical protein